MSKAINDYPKYQPYAAAFLQVFDRYRSRLMHLKLNNKRRANWMLACPPAGAAVMPQWPATWACDQSLICPFCRFRQAVELFADPWLPLDTLVCAYWKTYEMDDIRDWIEAKRGAVVLDRQAFARRLKRPYIRFQRIGLEKVDDRFIYRALQMLVTTERLTDTGNFTLGEGEYWRAVVLAMRYSAANLLAPHADLLRLMIIPKFRKVEYGRRKKY